MHTQRQHDQHVEYDTRQRNEEHHCRAQHSTWQGEGRGSELVVRGKGRVAVSQVLTVAWQNKIQLSITFIQQQDRAAVAGASSLKC